jgi:hypothetical protein
MICVEALERENLAKRQRRKGNSMYTMTIGDYHHLRNKNVYKHARTAIDDCFWTNEQEQIMTDVYEAHRTKVYPMRALNMSKLGTKA